MWQRGCATVGHCPLPERGSGIDITVQAELTLEHGLHLPPLGKFGQNELLANALLQEIPAEFVYRHMCCIPNATDVNAEIFN
jgi:hypothetical protein